MLPVIKIFILTTISFAAAMLWMPALARFLDRHKLGKQIRDAKSAPIVSRLHAKKSGTPTMGGVLIWGTVLVLTVALAWIGGPLSFLTRGETLLPLGALVASALVGLLDDFWNVRKIGPRGGGMRVRHKLLLYLMIAIVGAWWFFVKLEWDVFHVPFVGTFPIGIWYVPLFIFIIVATSFSVNETDGEDGLAGGTLLTAFGAFGAIAFMQGKEDLAAFCGVIVGALLAFLWFNIHPARFFMGDTGAMSLGVTLGIVAMLTNTALLLPIIGFVFLIESASVIIQLISKKIFHRKVFLSSPLHHHLEASGWAEPTIVMRFWVVSAISGAVGLILALVDRA